MGEKTRGVTTLNHQGKKTKDEKEESAGGKKRD